MSNTYDSDATEFLESQKQESDANCKATKQNDRSYGISKEQHAEKTADRARLLALPDSKKVWSVGDLCMAPFDDDYYAARIAKIYRDSNPMTAEVGFLDYPDDENEVVQVTSLCIRQRTEAEKNEEIDKTDGRRFLSANEAELSKSITKEKDEYMRKKYDSSDDEQTFHAKVARKKSSKKLDFKDKENKIKKIIESNKEVENHANANVNDVKKVCSVAKKFEEKESIAVGFADSDLEKPRLEVDPVGEKVPFVLSKQDDIRFAQIPATMNQYLRDYQREGVSFMYKRFQQNEGCILGDDMGLGKTVQVIAFLSAILGKTGNREDIMPSYFKKQKSKDDKRKQVGSFLIVSPSSVLYNWEDELNTWGYFKVAKFHGASKTETIEKAKRGKLEVVLTTYETFRNHIDIINEVNWLCIVMDEAHKVKETSSLVTKAAKKINCRCRIGLSGTPMQNNMEELWCLLDWANPGCLGTIEVFTSQFITPIKFGQRFDATKRELATARKKQQEFGLLKDKWMLRRTKELLTGQLPRKDERAVFAPLSDLQVALYRVLLDFPVPKMVKISNDPCICDSGKTRAKCCFKLSKEEGRIRQSEILKFITLLRKVSNHAALLLPYHKASEQQQQVAMSVCRKLFHEFPLLKEVYESGSFTQMGDVKFSGKLKIVDKLLFVMRQAKDKVLLFSTSVQLLNILEAYVISKGYVYRRLDGETKPENRTAIVREFNKNSDVFVCLVSTTAGGLGLNFTGANVVIIFDPAWNPSYDSQAQDRAYRIGQHRNVRVYRLIAEGSIEENVYLRQVYKLQLANIAVHTSNERRFFKAVAGCKSRPGELFGASNLFTLRTGESNLTNELLKRTERVESGVKVSNYELAESQNSKAVSRRDSNITDEENVEYENTTSQCIEEIESDIEECIEDSCSLFSGSEGEGNLPPLKWKGSSEVQGNKVVESCQDSRKNFTKIAKPHAKKRSAIPTSSEEDKELESANAEDKAPKKKIKRKKRHVRFEKSVKSSDSASLDKMDDILDQCGVKYTSTAKKVLSKSAAEEKMTTEAIKDVYWHGLNSQQPAHYFDPTSSEESDDIPCTGREAKQTADIIATKSARNKQKNTPTSLSKRVFERIGNDMFLIGETPPAIRRKQFEEIAKENGFETSLEFARKVVEWSEDKVVKNLAEFHKKKEPSVLEIASFGSIFSTMKLHEKSSLNLLEENFEGYDSVKGKRKKMAKKKTFNGTSSLSSKKEDTRTRQPQFRKNISLKRRSTQTRVRYMPESSRSSSDTEGKSDESLSCDEKRTLPPKRTARPHSRKIIERVPKFFETCELSEAKDVIEETQMDEFDYGLGESDDCGRTSESHRASKNDFEQHSKSTLSPVKYLGIDDSDSEEILEFMMFGSSKSPAKSKVNDTNFLSISNTRKERDVEIDVHANSGTDIENLNESFSILDELMDKGAASTVVSSEAKLREVEMNIAPMEFSESQNSSSVLDELMG